jgi:hypothetical protein
MMISKFQINLRGKFMMLIYGLIGAVPVLALAWGLRKLLRVQLNTRTASFSVLSAGLLGFVIRSFMEGEGDFQNRVANVNPLVSAELIPLIISTATAFILAILVARGRQAN